MVKSTLFADRDSQQWIVQDADGKYWKLSTSAEDAWEKRQPFHPTEKTELKPVPPHYKHMFGIPT